MGDEWRTNPDVMKIYVGGMSLEAEDTGVTNYFNQHGTVSVCNLIKDQSTGKCKGFGFVTFSTPEEVDELLEKTHVLDGKTLQVRRAIPRDDPNPLAHVKTKKLFVGGLTEEASEDDIKGVLEPMANAEIESVKLMRDRQTNKFKGYAFVTFSSEHPVDKLFIIRHATIKNKRVELKKAEDLSHGGSSSLRGGRGGARGGGRGGSRGRGGGSYGGGAGGGYGGGYQRGGNAYSGNYEGYDGYSGGYDQTYQGYGEDYSNGYGSYGGGYGGGYGGMGQYGSDPSGYGPSRRGRGGGRGRGAHSNPY